MANSEAVTRRAPDQAPDQALVVGLQVRRLWQSPLPVRPKPYHQDRTRRVAGARLYVPSR